jgi:hypothetical protein
LLGNDKETANILQSGKIEVLGTEYLLNERSGIELKKFRFCGKTPDHFVNVMVSQVWCKPGCHIPAVYKDKIEVDPTSPAINDFTSLQTALNNLPIVNQYSYTSLVVLKSTKVSEGKN